MPNRDDFEREYDPSAEQLVSNLALTPEDDEIETALKLAQVDIYNRRLRERARKKRLVRDYKLIHDFFRKFENGKVKNVNQTKDERGLRLSLKNFRQFYSNEAFERLINSLERERILRIRLTELCRYRWNGLTKIDECDHFEKHAAANQHRSTGPFGHGKTVSIPHSKLFSFYFHSTFRHHKPFTCCPLLSSSTSPFKLSLTKKWKKNLSCWKSVRMENYSSFFKKILDNF